jgi:hypothetical protein
MPGLFDGALSVTENHDVFAGAGGYGASATLSVTESHDVLLGVDTGCLYQVFSNTGAADPINYGVPIATTAALTWTSGPLAAPGTWRFGVRAFDTGGEEENLDCALTLILSAGGTDVSLQPAPPIGLRAFATAAAGIRVEWAYNTINPPVVPTGFHVYIGTSGSPNYTSAAATIAYGTAIASTFVANLTGLTGGTTYTIGVRAYNSVTEEPNTVTVNCTADGAGPSAVVELTATAIV